MDEKIDVGYEWPKQEKKKKRPEALIALSVFLILVLIGGIFLWSYNSIVNRSEQVHSAQAQIESNVQRKADLLPNLVKTVKAYARHEEKVFSEVARLRAEALPSASGAGIAKTAALDGRLNGTIARLFAVAENYPDLKASEEFLQLQSQIEGAENRINITRMRYNDAVRAYNASIRRIPGRWIAEMMGWKPAQYFETETSAKKPLKLEM